MEAPTNMGGEPRAPATAAVCGLCCDACTIFIGSHKDPARLQRFASTFGWSLEQAHCDGCRAGDRTPYCEACRLFACAQERGHEFCIECDDYPCTELESFRQERPHRAEIHENLSRIREIGANAWLAEVKRERYSCPDCGTLNSAYDLRCRACGREPGNTYVERHREEIVARLSS
jgi:hypothetical protein